MSYFLRLYAKSAERVTIQDLLTALPDATGWQIEVTGGSMETWSSLLVSTTQATPLFEVERNAAGEDGLFEEERQEFYEDLEGAKPASGAAWVTKYLGGACAVYSARYLAAAFDLADDLPGPNTLLWAIAGRIGGILQADGEGFSNEEGATVVWQFHDSVEGPRVVAVLGGDGQWLSQRIELSDRAHREAFFNGRLSG
jgi:hypothetical protein